MPIKVKICKITHWWRRQRENIRFHITKESKWEVGRCWLQNCKIHPSFKKMIFRPLKNYKIFLKAFSNLPGMMMLKILLLLRIRICIRLSKHLLKTIHRQEKAIFQKMTNLWIISKNMQQRRRWIASKNPLTKIMTLYANGEHQDQNSKLISILMNSINKAIKNHRGLKEIYSTILSITL